MMPPTINGHAIQTTFGACLDAEPALTQLAGQAWPIKTAYHLARLLRFVRERTRAFEDQRVAIVKDLGTPRPPTDAERARGLLEEVIEVPPDKIKEYMGSYTDLRALATDIPWGPLTLAAFGDAQQVTAAALVDLGPFLEDPPDPSGGDV